MVNDNLDKKIDEQEREHDKLKARIEAYKVIQNALDVDKMSESEVKALIKELEKDQAAIENSKERQLEMRLA